MRTSWLAVPAVLACLAGPMLPSAPAAASNVAGKECSPLFFDFREITVQNVECKTAKSVIRKAVKQLGSNGDKATINGFRCTQRAQSYIVCTKNDGRKKITYDARE